MAMVKLKVEKVLADYLLYHRYSINNIPYSWVLFGISRMPFILGLSFVSITQNFQTQNQDVRGWLCGNVPDEPRFPTDPHY